MWLDCATIAEPIFDGDYGKCFLLNTSKMEQKVQGVGLSLVLSLDFQNAYSNGQIEPPLYDGVIMKVAHKFDPGQSEYTLLSPGTFTRAGLKMKKLNLIQRERKKAGQTCVKKEEADRLLTVIKAEYSMGVCHMDCLHRIPVKYCHCHLPLDKRLVIDEHKNWTYCTTKQLDSCAYPKMYEYGREVGACAAYCKTPCEMYEYSIQLSTAQYPHFKLHNDYMTDDMLPFEIREKRDTLSATTEKPDPYLIDSTAPWSLSGSDKIILDLAYNSMHYVEITQEDSMTLNTFISNIGGQVGLWMGASAISLVKFFVVIMPSAFCLVIGTKQIVEKNGKI